MACKNVKYTGNKGSKLLGRKTTAQQVNNDCCNPQPGCIIPRDEEGNVIQEELFDALVGECIFVDKVHDAILIQSTFPFFRAGDEAVNTGIVAAGRTVASVTIDSCRPVRNPQDADRLIVTPNSTLSGVTLGNTIIGPGGTEQVEIFIPDDECAELLPPRGRRIFGTQETTIEGDVEITYTVVFTNGQTATNTVRVPVPAGASLTNFFELCVPPLGGSPFYPQFTEFCGAICDAGLLTGGPGDVRIVNGFVVVDTLVLICITCEKKIKAPVQLCVLSLGECDQDVEQPFFACPEFPNLFPIQIDPEENGEA